MSEPEAFRIYLGIVTVLMGGATGLLASRSMDAITDQRRIRRKLFVARNRIRDLLNELQQPMNDFEKITAGGTRIIDETSTGLTEEESTRVFPPCDEISRIGDAPPNFDDLRKTGQRRPRQFSVLGKC